MRRWQIIDLGSLDEGITKEFNLKLPSDFKEIVGVTVFAPKYMSVDASKVTLKLSIQTNNKTIFNGNPVIALGKRSPGDSVIDFIDLNVEMDGNYIEGYVSVVSNILAEPFNAKLYILLK